MYTMESVDYAAWLVHVMRTAGVSQRELIRRVSADGVNRRQSVYRWLAGTRADEESCRRIAAALGIDEDEVLHVYGWPSRYDDRPEASREDVPPPDRAAFPSPQPLPYEGGSTPLTSREIIEIRARLQAGLTIDELRMVRSLLPALKGMTAGEVYIMRGLVRSMTMGEPDDDPPPADVRERRAGETPR